MVLSVITKNHRSAWQHRSRTKPAINHPPGKNVLQHRTPVISECLSKSAGFIDSSQSIQLQWDDFYLVSRPPRRNYNSGKVSGTYRHRLYGLPRIPLPGHTRKITFVTMISLYKSALASLTCWFAGILLFDFYPGGVLFVHPRLYPHPYPKGTRPYPHRPITAACLSANHNGPFMS